MTPLQSNRYWSRADAPGRAELLAALGALKVGERLRLADVTRAIVIADDAVPETGERATAPGLVEYTTGAIRADQVDEDTREVDVAFSSETPYPRWWGIEVLGHAAGECDLEWANSGRAPVLADHDTCQQVGVILNAQIGRDRRGRSRWRFGKSARAEQELRDVKDGVRVNVSVGYEISELELVKQEGDERTYRAVKWRPLEESTVSIPADMTVGIGRSIVEELPPPKPRKERTMDKTDDPVDLDKVRAEAREAAIKAEQERTKGILALATRHNMRELGERAINDNVSLELFRGVMLDELHKKGSDKPLDTPATLIGLSRVESERFSVARYMHSLIEKDSALAPFEQECARAVRAALEKAGVRSQRAGNYLPLEVMSQPLPGVRVVDGHLMIGDRVIASQRDMSSLTNNAGGSLVATNLLASDFITLLRNASLVRRMGARVLGGLVGSVDIPRQTGTTTPGWVAQGGAASESDITVNKVSMSPKTAHSIQDVTRDLLIQGTPGVEGLIRADLIDAMATQLDYIALNGTGSSNQPTGLLNTSGIGAVAGGTNGAAPSWDNIVDLESQVANANGAQGALGYLSNTRVRGKLKRTQKFSGTNGQEIWMPAMSGDDSSVFGSLNGYRAGVSNNMRNDLTKGTSSGICSAIAFGNWLDLLIGEWGTAEILPDQLTQAANRIVRMHIYQSIDIAVRRGGSFAAMQDALTT